MIFKSLMAAVTIAAGISATTAMVATPAHAQSAVEAEIIGFHQLCDKGDRKACVRFGILIAATSSATPIGAGRTPTGFGTRDKYCGKAATLGGLPGWDKAELI